eukprot:466234_1
MMSTQLCFSAATLIALFAILYAKNANVFNSADPPPPLDASCGTSGNYRNISISNGSMVCIPNSCDYDSCPPKLGVCNNTYGVSNSNCIFSNGDYKGIQSYPYGVTTWYCTLNSGQGCNGGACGDRISQSLLNKYGVTGIAAVNSALYGLSQNRNNKIWGQGCTHNSKICYYLKGPGGAANVMITDRCAGYCTFKSVNSVWKCDPDGTLYQDCGQCDDTWDQDPSKTHPSCPCIGTEGNMYPSCCGAGVSGCNSVLNECDWCSGNNHPHFDLDSGTFNHVCGRKAENGDCVLTKVLPFVCG